jgi:hypothetical protein
MHLVESLTHCGKRAADRLLTAGQQTYWRVAGDRLSGPVLVFQMGKVGSSSVFYSLQRAALSASVYHAHMLTDLDEMEAAIRSRYPDASQTLDQIENGRMIRDELDSDPNRSWSVITMTRDPIAQNVSAFFQRLPEIAPELAAPDSPVPSNQEVEALVRAFEERYGEHKSPLNWFDDQFTPVFGVDLLAQPFAKERGWDISTAGVHRVLSATMESLDSSGSEAIGSLLGRRSFQLLRRNEGKRKGYSTRYEAFCKAYRPTDDYIERMYDSRMVRHFYTDKAVDEFVARWRSSGTGISDR